MTCSGGVSFQLTKAGALGQFDDVSMQTEWKGDGNGTEDDDDSTVNQEAQDGMLGQGRDKVRDDMGNRVATDVRQFGGDGARS